MDDVETVLLVERDVALLRRLQITRQIITVRSPKHRLNDAAADAAALISRIDAENHQIPMRRAHVSRVQRFGVLHGAGWVSRGARCLRTRNEGTPYDLRTDVLVIQVGDARRAIPHADVRRILQPPSWVSVVPVALEAVETITDDLDLGERSAIALAATLGADLLLIDEAAGRAEARRRNLRVTGTLGVLRAGAEQVS